MTLFASALRLPEDYFAQFIGHPVSALQALDYLEQTVAPQPGQLRAGARSDCLNLPILLPQPGSKGIKIEQPDGRWMDVLPIPGAFIISIGDLVQRWTNERWVSTVHRMANPAEGREAGTRPQSFAFQQPDWFAEIGSLDVCLWSDEVAKHRPQRSGHYLMGKFKPAVMG